MSLFCKEEQHTSPSFFYTGSESPKIAGKHLGRQEIERTPGDPADAGGAAPDWACKRHLMSSVGQATILAATPAPRPATNWSLTSRGLPVSMLGTLSIRTGNGFQVSLCCFGQDCEIKPI